MAVSSVKQVMKRFCVGHSTLYKLIKRGLFLKPRKLGRKSVWRNEDLDRFEAALPYASEVKAKPKLKILKLKQPTREEADEIELPASLQK